MDIIHIPAQWLLDLPATLTLKKKYNKFSL